MRLAKFYRLLSENQLSVLQMSGKEHLAQKVMFGFHDYDGHEIQLLRLELRKFNDNCRELEKFNTIDET